ncbi:unnamed protein product [Diabrotica balteata]|uniref:DUF7041 domain-containing protein n=1 Tax=Diabrotica balteata TaxID=107213 RepID=A0A9N9TAU0_DIABA|nr:unnamed protein product [Diabrotica balteata]
MVFFIVIGKVPYTFTTCPRVNLEIFEITNDGEDNNYSSSCDTLFGDNSNGDEYVPDPKDYIDSSSDNEIDNEMVDAQSNNELMEEENDILMEDNNIHVSQAKSNENIVGHNEKEYTLPTVHRKKKHFQPKIKMTNTDQTMPNINITTCEVDDHSLIARVGIKAPEFWRTEPELWFFWLEAQFRQAKITTDNCKFDHTVASLNSEVLIEVADIAKNPTAGNAYIQLKARLLDRYGTSSDEKILNLMELTQALAMDSISTQVLKNFWLDRLPPSVRSVISILDGDLEELAKKADTYLRCSSFPVMVVTESSTLDKTVTALSDQVNALSNRLTVAEEGQQIQMVKTTKSSSDEQCYYHQRFGAQAKKCRPPCNFTKNDQRAQ